MNTERTLRTGEFNDNFDPMVWKALQEAVGDPGFLEQWFGAKDFSWAEAMTGQKVRLRGLLFELFSYHYLKDAFKSSAQTVLSPTQTLSLMERLFPKGNVVFNHVNANVRDKLWVADGTLINTSTEGELEILGFMEYGLNLSVKVKQVELIHRSLPKISERIAMVSDSEIHVGEAIGLNQDLLLARGGALDVRFITGKNMGAGYGLLSPNQVTVLPISQEGFSEFYNALAS